MRHVLEAEIEGVMDLAVIEAAVERALVAAADGSADLNPVVIGRGLDEGQIFSIKSGRSRRDRLVGLKVGGYWPGAERLGLARHGSVVLLLDADTGRLRALVEASRLNGPRTAAADAVAARRLARDDARVLGVIGAGHQAAHEIRALARTRPLERVLVANRSPERIAGLRDALAGGDLPTVEAVGVEACCRQADLLVTVTNATAPLFDADWIRPGTHIAAMGSDQRGKQELPPALLRGARLFCDLPSQSLTVGEFQHLDDETAARGVVAIGDVVASARPGRGDADEITVFDSSGLALQDLYVANAMLDRLGEAAGR